MKILYTVKEMTDLISAYFKEKGYQTEIYSDVFLPARVPVYASKQIGKGTTESVEEVAVDIINSPKIRSADFFYTFHIPRTLVKGGLELRDASSATFFQYYFPKAKVYWAYPDYLKEDEKFSEFKNLCQKNKIGLFKVSKTNIKEIISPIPLIDIVFTKYSKKILPVEEYLQQYAKKHAKSLIQEMHNELYKVLDLHIEETNKYLIYYPEPEYKRREIIGRTEGKNISLTLVDKMAEIENLNYKSFLHELAERYRPSSDDDYIIALDLTKKLWENIGLEYPEFQKDFEPVLLLNPRYRDHFLHQLHVFLLGCYVLDRLYNAEPIKMFERKFGNAIEDIWLLASTYHDFNYNIQNYDDWIKTFFKNTLFLNENPSSLKLDECYVKEDYMFKTRELCDAFENLNVDKISLLFFYDQIIDKKNHGLLGALSLLKLFDQESSEKIDKKALLQAARAISLHDESVWEHFSGRAESEFSQKKLLEKLKFEEDPLSFLLIYCDTIQEWGRVGRDYEKTGARLDDIGYTKGLIWVNISVTDENAFNYKRDEIDRVKGFLLDKKFKIKLSTRAGSGANIIERYMDGNG